jgi:hypothetical protein
MGRDCSSVVETKKKSRVMLLGFKSQFTYFVPMGKLIPLNLNFLFLKKKNNRVIIVLTKLYCWKYEIRLCIWSPWCLAHRRAATISGRRRSSWCCDLFLPFPSTHSWSFLHGMQFLPFIPDYSISNFKDFSWFSSPSCYLNIFSPQHSLPLLG